MIDLVSLQVKNGSTWHLVCPFPIGFVYSSYTNTSPAGIFGGSWTAITGRFPYYNAGTALGGANTHTLTAAQMPSHNHSLIDHIMLYSIGNGGAVYGGSSSTILRTNSGYTGTGSTGGGKLTTTCLLTKLYMHGDAQLRGVA